MGKMRHRGVSGLELGIVPSSAFPPLLTPSFKANMGWKELLHAAAALCVSSFISFYFCEAGTTPDGWVYWAWLGWS